MEITIKQLLQLVMVLSDTTPRDIANATGLNYMTVSQKMNRGYNFQFIKQVFNICKMSLDVEWNGHIFKGFCISDLTDDIAFLSHITGVEYQVLKRAIKKDKIKIEVLKKIFTRKGQTLNFIINKSKFKIAS